MPSLTQTLAILAWAMAVASASPAADRLDRRQTADFSVDQVANPNRVDPDGPLDLYAAYSKFNMHIPSALKEYAHNAMQRKAKVLARGMHGTADAIPYMGVSAEWVTRMRVGTPAQTLHVTLDAGSARSWLLSDLLPASQQKSNRVYSPSKSKTAKKTGQPDSIDFADGQFSGTLSGEVYVDAISLDKCLGYDKQAFIAVNHTTRPNVNGMDVDGVLALGFSGWQEETDPKKVPLDKTFFENIKDRLSRPAFGVDLRKHKPGAFHFGFIPENKYIGQLSYLPADTSNYVWNITAAGYAIGNAKNFTAQPLPGIADTITTFLLLPDSICKPYYAQVQGSHYNVQLGGYVFPCGSNLPDLSLKMGDNMIAVPGQYFNYTTVTDDNNKPNGECFGSLQIAWMDFVGDGTKTNIFGAMIHQAAYVVYDDRKEGPRVGWANKKL